MTDGLAVILIVLLGLGLFAQAVLRDDNIEFRD